MTLTPPQIRYILVLMGCDEYGSLIRPNDAFSASDVLSLRDQLKLGLDTTND